MDKCTVPAHSAHHADNSYRSRLKKKMTSKKQVDGDCVVYDCARSSIVDKRLQNAKKKGNGFFYSTISSENQFTSNPLKQTERSNAIKRD